MTPIPHPDSLPHPTSACAQAVRHNPSLAWMPGDLERELFNTLKKETNLILDSMTPSSAFTTLISMKQGEKTQKIVAKYVYDRFRERDRRVKYNLV